MHWLNLHIPTTLRSPEFVGSSPAERGTWLCVLAYACSLECGGRLVGAGVWRDRQWQQACGVTWREVKAADRLLTLEGHDVIVHGYPCSREMELQVDRSMGRTGGERSSPKKAAAARLNGLKGGRKPKPNNPTEPNGETQETQRNPSQNPREGKGIGREGEGNAPPLGFAEGEAEDDPEDLFIPTARVSTWTERELAVLAVVERLGGLLDAPGGACLRREWIATLTGKGYGKDLVERTFKAAAPCEFPSRFRKAIGASAGEVAEARTADEWDSLVAQESTPRAQPVLHPIQWKTA